MKVFLIGLPGSGKTTWGKQLAEKLSITFIDLDLEIERREGKTVQEIFAIKKENYFREVESRTLKNLCSDTSSFVMATGGGTPCFFDNMELMNKSGKTFFLDPPVSEITSRLLKTNLSERPLFAKLGTDQLKDKIQWLRSQRISFYKQAHTTIDTSFVSLDDLAQKITY
ncbi:shikimate kinase [Cytophagales bacterium WSM2-2]|nr:shikimate kinase [Cytophagales bacterium WSM2-2]